MGTVSIQNVSFSYQTDSQERGGPMYLWKSSRELVCCYAEKAAAGRPQSVNW